MPCSRQTRWSAVTQLDNPMCSACCLIVLLLIRSAHFAGALLGTQMNGATQPHLKTHPGPKRLVVWSVVAYGDRLCSTRSYQGTVLQQQSQRLRRIRTLSLLGLLLHKSLRQQEKCTLIQWLRRKHPHHLLYTLHLRRNIKCLRPRLLLRLP